MSKKPKYTGRVFRETKSRANAKAKSIRKSGKTAVITPRKRVKGGSSGYYIYTYKK